MAVATETSSERVFDVVTEEVARLVGADAANLVRFGPVRREAVDRRQVERAGGARSRSAGTIVSTRRRAARRGGADGRAGPDATTTQACPPSSSERLAAARRHVARRGADRRVGGRSGARSSVSVTRDLQFAPNAEERLGQFAGLVAVAIANAQAREELATLADEQAALSRVAVAVATEERPERLFNVVSEEVGRLFGADGARNRALRRGCWTMR